MQCEICGQGPFNGVSIFRTNPKGQKGIWRCEAHLGETKVDPDVMELVSTIESSGKVKQ